jgi:hypothetical protein
MKPRHIVLPRSSKRVIRFLALAIVAAIVGIAAPSTTEAEPVLSVAGTKFQVDGRDTFIVGASLFDALGSSPPRDADLDALQGWGVTLVRVWAHWSEPIYQADGALTPLGRTRLLRLVERLGARRMLIELVLLRPGQLPGQRFAVFASPEARVRAVESITRALRPHRHVLFDLYNENDHPDGPISQAAARQLRDAVKAVHAERLVTISSTAGHLVGAGAAANLRGEVHDADDSVAVDVIAPHFPRTADWAATTGGRIRALRSAADALGRSAPIYLNEERRSDKSQPVRAEDYRRAYQEAIAAGAAGWVFHTAAGFSLRTRSFLDALGAEERTAIERLVQTP